MARKLRIQYAGAVYHVTIRGVGRRRIFDDAADRERFLIRLGEAVEEEGVRLYLFCLMANHVHLVVETPRSNLSVFMHKLQTAYTVYYNLRHGRSGHLTQGRFGAKPVEGSEYLLKLSRYVHLNPVFAGTIRRQPIEVRVRHLQMYPWSSYRGYAGLAKPYEFVDEAPVLAVKEAGTKRRRAYRRFVEGGISKTDEEFAELLSTSQFGIGDAEFQARVRDLHTDLVLQARRKEDVSFRRIAPRVSADAVIAAVCYEFRVDASALRRRRYACVERAVAAMMLGRHAGMSQRDVAAFLCMGTGSAVCRQLQRLRERCVVEPALAGCMERTHRALECDAARISIVKG